VKSFALLPGHWIGAPDGRRIQSSPMVAMDRRKELLAGLDISLLALEVAYSKGAKVAVRQELGQMGS